MTIKNAITGEILGKHNPEDIKFITIDTFAEIRKMGDCLYYGCHWDDKGTCLVITTAKYFINCVYPKDSIIVF